MTKILQPHPALPSEIASFLDAADKTTATNHEHRLLVERNGARSVAQQYLRKALAVHHADDDKRRRFEDMNKILAAEGLPLRSLYPRNLNTQKGNLAEVVLAEYLMATDSVSLPVYRLRFNQNVEQSIKGDDVLAFDLDSDPIRIIVGETKFRSTPSPKDVRDIVESLVKAHTRRIPSSLQFIADILYHGQQRDLARRVEQCSIEIARRRAQLDYVGLLLSNPQAGLVVEKHTPLGAPRRLAMISMAIDQPEALVLNCFNGLV